MPKEDSPNTGLNVSLEPLFTTTTPVPLASLGEVLVALRKERGITQQALAEQLGTLQEAVAKMERERYRSVSLERLVKVVDVLGAQVLVTPYGQGPDGA